MKRISANNLLLPLLDTLGRASYCRALSVANGTGYTTCENRIGQLPCAHLCRTRDRPDTSTAPLVLGDHATPHFPLPIARLSELRTAILSSAHTTVGP
ncbi:hypothetical protein BpHYR1_014132 [Brachionus plicatilis]|uniref:Secreted protein n=1 Tax=Brachionus plicatilis TaxID=10195 RepID=A0A3M7QSZ4_BRAPC|nr:hypothetical protein BpHYR1_014132 [Brachionus plicatilis]